MTEEKKDQTADSRRSKPMASDENAEQDKEQTKTEKKQSNAKTADESQEKKIVVEETTNTQNATPEKEVTEKAEETKTTTPKEIYADVVPGATVRIHQKIKEKKGKEEKERIQIFEGIILARKHGNQDGATITVKKIAKGGFGVEKIYPLRSPIIDKIEVVKQAKVRRAKLEFLKKDYKKKLKYRK